MDQEEAEHHLLLRKCRLCAKSFPCGHTRCHLSSSSMEDKHDSTDKAPTNGCGLGENPRKTRRPSSADSWSVPKRKRMPRPRCPIDSGPSPPEYEEEQVDVAVSLMILSRDIGFWSTAFAQSSSSSSDKNSAVPVDSASDVDEAPAGLYSVSSVTSAKKKKKSRRYECATCNKSFHSYQALGGHRSAHKRGRGCLGDSGPEADASVDDHRTAEGGREAEGGHQCGICRKVFASGQALGGHKRTHLVRSSATAPAIEEEEEAVSDLLDLNFPAPVDEDSADLEFESWWAGSGLKSESMVGMIA